MVPSLLRHTQDAGLPGAVPGFASCWKKCMSEWKAVSSRSSLSGSGTRGSNRKSGF